MAGMATLTVKKSSTIMNVPAISTASAAQRLAASRANARATVGAFSAVGAVLVSSASVTMSSFRQTTAGSSVPTGAGVVDYPVGKDGCTYSLELAASTLPVLCLGALVEPIRQGRWRRRPFTGWVMASRCGGI